MSPMNMLRHVDVAMLKGFYFHNDMYGYMSIYDIMISIEEICFHTQINLWLYNKSVSINSSGKGEVH